MSDDEDLRLKSERLHERLGWSTRKCAIGVGDRTWVVYCYYAHLKSDITEHEGWPVTYESVLGGPQAA